MKLLFLGCLALGSLVVFQPLLNRLISEQRGLAIAVWLNGLVLFTGGCLILITMLISTDQGPEIVNLCFGGMWHWWYVLPGLMGLALVSGVPFMISGLGAFSTVVALLSGQLLTSFLWDQWALQQTLSIPRLLGLVLVLAGAYLSIRPAT